MGLICTTTIGGNTRRIASSYRSDLTYPYYGEIVSLSNFKLACKSKSGGYLRPSFGSFSILPSAFSNEIFSVVPPPINLSLPIDFVFDDLSTTRIVDATGQLASISEEEIEYDLYKDEYDYEVSSGYTGTLIGYFTWACDSSRLNLTLDSSKATDYNVGFTFSDARQVLDVMDSVANDTNHGFYIENSTLYLIDLANTNNTVDLTEYEFVKATYSGPVPYSVLKSGDTSITGTYPHGDELSVNYMFSTNTSYITAQLTRLKTIMDKYWITIEMPIEFNTIKYGDKVTWTDTNIYESISIEMWAREFNYTFDEGTEKVVIRGEGNITA